MWYLYNNNNNNNSKISDILYTELKSLKGITKTILNLKFSDVCRVTNSNGVYQDFKSINLLTGVYIYIKIDITILDLCRITNIRGVYEDFNRFYIRINNNIIYITINIIIYDIYGDTKFKRIYKILKVGISNYKSWILIYIEVPILRESIKVLNIVIQIY